MHFWRFIFTLTLLQTAIFSSTTLEVKGSLNCDENDKCGLKAYYKDKNGATISKNPINSKRFTPNLYTSIYSPDFIKTNGEFYYVDENINFKFNKYHNTLYITDYKIKIDPIAAPFQIDNPNEPWQVYWVGNLHVKDIGRYAFFVDINDADIKIKLNGEILELNSINADEILNLKTKNLNQDIYTIEINFKSHNANSSIALLWLNLDNTDLTTGRLKFKEPKNDIQKMRVIGKDSFSYNYNKLFNLQTQNITPKVIDGEFYSSSLSFRQKWDSPTRSKKAGVEYRYCIITANNQNEIANEIKNTNLEFDIYAKEVFRDSNLKLKSKIEFITRAKANECFSKKYDSHLSVSFAAIAGKNSKQTAQYFFDNNLAGSMNDSFSVLPKGFKINSNNTKFSILKAGESNDIKISAYDFNKNLSNYNTILNQKTYILKDKTYYTNSLIPQLNDKICIKEFSNINLGQNLYFKSGQADINLPIIDDVMDYKINVIDDEFSHVDSWRYKNFDKLTKKEQDFIKKQTLEYGYQCSGIEIANIKNTHKSEQIIPCIIKNDDNDSLSIIPASFEINSILTGEYGANFTYIHDIKNDIKNNINSNMLAYLDIKLIPKNMQGNELKNFTSSCYAKDIKIDIDNKTKNKPIYALSKNYTYRKNNDDNTTFTIKKEIFNKNNNFKIGFNFDKNNTNKEPFIVKSNDFNITNLYLAQTQNTQIGYIQKTKNKAVAMLYAKAYIPFHEGVKNITTHEYYGFYCKYSCDILNEFNLLKNTMPNNANWYINPFHTNNFGSAVDYKSSLKNKDKSVTQIVGNITNGVREIKFINTKKTNSKERLIAIFDSNTTWIDHEPFWLNFYLNNENWAGNSYNQNGVKKDVGNFIKDSGKDKEINRKNRRIEW